jgi:hypothetical protein
LEHANTHAGKELCCKPVIPSCRKGLNKDTNYNVDPDDVQGDFATKSLSGILEELERSQIKRRAFYIPKGYLQFGRQFDRLIEFLPTLKCIYRR